MASGLATRGLDERYDELIRRGRDLRCAAASSRQYMHACREALSSEIRV